MSRIAILGAGAGGAAAAVDLSRRGHAVRVWSRSAGTVAPFVRRGGIGYDGIYGGGLAPVPVLTADLGEALEDADFALACLPAMALGDLGRSWSGRRSRLPLILNPGGTGGAMITQAAMREAGIDPPPIAETSTLTYTARKSSPGAVTISGEAISVRVAALPGGEPALEAALELYPRSTPMSDVIGTGLSNLNMVVNTPISVYSLAWIEATGGSFRFYGDALTPGVARTIAALDEERRALASALGHDLPALTEELVRVGLIGSEAAAAGFAEALGGDGAPAAAIMAPDSLGHRYFSEDFGYGLLPFLGLARVAGVPTPIGESLLTLVRSAVPDARFAVAGEALLGIQGLDREGLLARIAGRPR